MPYKFFKIALLLKKGQMQKYFNLSRVEQTDRYLTITEINMKMK